MAKYSWLDREMDGLRDVHVHAQIALRQHSFAQPTSGRRSGILGNRLFTSKFRVAPVVLVTQPGLYLRLPVFPRYHSCTCQSWWLSMVRGGIGSTHQVAPAND